MATTITSSMKVKPRWTMGNLPRFTAPITE